MYYPERTVLFKHGYNVARQFFGDAHLQPSHKTLLTDFDDTIHSFQHASTQATKAVCRHLASKTPHYNARDLAELYKQVCQQYVTSFADGRTSQQYRTERMQALLYNAGMDMGHAPECVDIYADALSKNLRLEPTVLETLQELHARGVPIVVVSEAPHDAQEQTIAELGIAPYIDCLFTSNQQKMSKPEGLWQTVMEQLNLQPSQCIVLGDSVPSDIIPAQDLNLLAVLYDPHDKIGNAPARITQFSQIKDYLL